MGKRDIPEFRVDETMGAPPNLGHPSPIRRWDIPTRRPYHRPRMKRPAQCLQHAVAHYVMLGQTYLTIWCRNPSHKHDVGYGPACPMWPLSRLFPDTAKGQKSEPFGTNKKGQRSVRKPL